MQLPELPRFPEVYGLRAAAIAAYPMYRGLAKLVGMDVIKTGGTFADEIATLREHWQAYDFFFVHYKDTDKAGEDGNFDAKVEALERFDAFVPAVRGARARRARRHRRSRHALRARRRTAGSRCPVLVWSRYCGADPGQRVRRARVRRGHAGRAAGASPDADRHGQRAEAHEVRRLVAADAVPDPSSRCALAGDAGRQRRLRLVRGARGAHAAGRGPPAPGRPGRRRRARGLRAAGGPRSPHRLRARVQRASAVRIAPSRIYDAFGSVHRGQPRREALARSDLPARHRGHPEEPGHARLRHRERPHARWCTWCRCSRTSA